MTNNTTKALDKNEFGNNLWRIREQRNVTHEQLAEAIDKSPRYIYKLESGDAFPSLDTLISICNALGVNVDSILRRA